MVPPYLVSAAGRHLAVAALLLALYPILGACDSKRSEESPRASTPADSGRAPLSPELKAKVLAKVGSKTITLGQYAATLERMDEFERLRYQSPERRKKLLDEMINAELLAQEAERRGLHKKPETEQRLRQMLRDELFARLRSQLPKPNEIPESVVRRYYAEHRAEFRDPERRRVAHIVFSNRAKAEAVLEQARIASATEWGKLVQEHSLDKSDKTELADPLELAGDLGIVSAPSAEVSDNPRVTEPVRQAVFKLDKIGAVHGELVEVDGKFHIVRMTGKTEARDRTYTEAERAIRVAIVQRKIRQQEAELEKKLRERYPVKVDSAALRKVRLRGLEKQP